MTCEKCGKEQCVAGFCRLAPEYKIAIPLGDDKWEEGTGWKVNGSIMYKQEELTHCLEMVPLLPGAMVFDYRRESEHSHIGNEILRDKDTEVVLRTAKWAAQDSNLPLAIRLA